MEKFRITFSFSYTDVDYDWDESPIGETSHTSYSDEIIVDKNLTLAELLELKEKTEQENYNQSGIYTDIQIEKIES